MFSTLKNSKSKYVITFTAAVMALTVTAASFSTQASAGKRERWIAGGIVAGIIGTAIVAGDARRRSHSRASRWERHVWRCQRSYRSYDEESDTYIDYNGNERVCRK